MKKILIVTDAWKPQVNGVVTTMTTIVEELKKKGKVESRANLIQIGNDLRNSGGPSVLADLMIKNLISSESHIVDSIRNPSEVDSLNRKYDNHIFNLFLVDAAQKIRFDRLKKRGISLNPLISFFEVEI